MQNSKESWDPNQVEGYNSFRLFGGIIFMRFVNSRSLAVKKDHEERMENYKKACADAKDWDEASVIAQTSIFGELITLNETMAACADYLGTIANILNSSKGGK